MEEKLIKVDNGWVLMVDNIMYATDNDKLSLKNCKAIENGYDLDDLLKKEIANGKLHPNDGAKKEGIERGIQIALEIFGDKKFSEEDIKKAIEIGEKSIILNSRGSYLESKTIKENYIQSLQQTEWDVEIEMEQYVKYVPKSLETVYPTGGVRPKLDADGCLILKTFKSE